jgi:hypothetical protein
MEKARIIRFLKERRRGVYNLIVESYGRVVTSMTATMAHQVIKEDLEKESGEPIRLTYVSLAQAIVRFKKTLPKDASGKAKPDFPDAHELDDKKSRAGYFEV